MSDLRTAAQQALEALDGLSEPYYVLKAQDALRAALEQPEQEPFGYFQYAPQFDAWVQNRDDTKGVAFYTHPPRREWQGLTDTEIGMEYVKWDATPGASMADFARAIEAALKEKNT